MSQEAHAAPLPPPGTILVDPVVDPQAGRCLALLGGQTCKVDSSYAPIDANVRSGHAIPVNPPRTMSAQASALSPPDLSHRFGPGLRRKIAIMAVTVILAWWVLPRMAYELTVLWVHNCGSSMGWVDRAEAGLALLNSVTLDKQLLADRLLEEEDGSLVCEGMILAYRIKHPDLRRLLTEHLNDTRWNWAMSLNSIVARQLLDHLDGRNEHVEEFVLRWIENWPH